MLTFERIIPPFRWTQHSCSQGILDMFLSNHIQLCWILEDLNTISITYFNIAFRLILTRHIFHKFNIYFYFDWFQQHICANHRNPNDLISQRGLRKYIQYSIWWRGDIRHFWHRVLAIFQIFGVNDEKIKRRIVQKVWVMDIRCQEKSCLQWCIRHVNQDFGALTVTAPFLD